MKKIITLSVAFLVVSLAFCYSFWKIKEEESEVKFSIKNLGKHVKGSIKGMKAEITFDENNLNHCLLKGSVDVNTINTGIKKRDKHLRSADFLDVEKFPQITYSANKISKTAQGYVAHGKLTIKDVSKDIDLPFTFENKGSSGIFKGTITIDRTEFNVGKKSKIMGELVTVDIIAAVGK